MTTERYYRSQVYREIAQHIPHLRCYARSIARNSAVAEDLVQESLARALAKWELFREGTNLRAWLFTILHNLHISEMRRQSQAGIAVDPDMAASALASPPDQDRALVVLTLPKAMMLLPHGQRRAIEMVAIDGMSYEDTATALDLPVGTVKSRISRGRNFLRAAVEGIEGGPAADARAATGGD